MDPGGFNPAQFPPGLANAFNAYCQLPQLQHQHQPPQGPPQPPPGPSQPEAPGAPPQATQIPFFQQPYNGYPMHPIHWQWMQGMGTPGQVPPNYNVPGQVPPPNYNVPGQFQQQQQQPWIPSLFQVTPAAHPPSYGGPVQNQPDRPQGAASTSSARASRIPCQAGLGPHSQREPYPGPLAQPHTRSGPPAPAPSQSSAVHAARSYSNEEKRRMVAEALKRGKAEGLSGKHILDKLEETHKHMNVDWKEFFLTNLEELWAPHSDAHTDGSSKLGATSTRTPDIVQRQPQVKTTISKNASRSSDGASSPDPPFPASRTRIYGNRPRILPLPASHKKQKQAYGTRPHGAGASSSAETPRLSSSVGSASTHASSSRKRRGAPVEDYHDSTYIPVLSDNVKPAPPHRDAPGLFSRFTDDDKVFFIQYLRWRLHERPFPTKHELYDELAAQTPHHNAKAWKKHWADFSELPDKVYIAARQREDRERDASSSSEAKSTPGVSGSERNGDTSELSSIPSPPSKARSGEPVTEADLRRMAQYTVEKNAVWKAEGTRLVARWKEFSERPENRKRRSHDGWWSAARDHSDELDVYVQEIRAGTVSTSASSGDPAVASRFVSATPLLPRSKPPPPISKPAPPISKPLLTSIPPSTSKPPPPTSTPLKAPPTSEPPSTFKPPSTSNPPPPTSTPREAPPRPPPAPAPASVTVPPPVLAPPAPLQRTPPAAPASSVPLTKYTSTTTTQQGPNADSGSERSRKRPAPSAPALDRMGTSLAEKRQRREDANDVYIVERQLKKEDDEEDDDDDDVIILSSDV